MATEIKRILIKTNILVGDILIEPNKEADTWLILYDNCELRILEEKDKELRLYEPINTNNTKTIWQKAQQQVDNNKNDKRYNKPFEDDGAYADD